MKALRLYGALLLFFLWLPLLAFLSKGFRTSAFERLWQNQELQEAFAQSLLLAGLSASIATSMALMTLLALPQLSPKARQLLQSSIVLPLVLPEIAFALSYLVGFQLLGFSFGWGTLIAAHSAFCFSYALLALQSNFQVNWTLEEAARDLGANTWQRFRHAIFPQVLPGIIVALLLSFSLSLDDFFLSFFVKGIEQLTLPIKIYSMARLKVGEEIYALSLVLFCISSASVLIAQVWQKKS